MTSDDTLMSRIPVASMISTFTAVLAYVCFRERSKLRRWFCPRIPACCWEWRAGLGLIAFGFAHLGHHADVAQSLHGGAESVGRCALESGEPRGDLAGAG